MRIGLWTWPAFVVVDAWMCFVAFPGAPFGLFVACRVAVEAVMAAVYLATFTHRVGLRVVLAGQNLAYGVAAAAIAVMAVPLGGIDSVYMHGISIVTLVRAAVIPEPWNRSWPIFATIGLVFPFVMLGVVIWSPSVRLEWFDSNALIAFASNYIFVISSAFLGMVSGNLVWRAQEQVYKARRIGRYRLIAPIGKGGMGEVWLSWDLSLQRNVALKLLRTVGDTGPDIVARFEREALATSRLRSPHVVQIYDYGASEDGLYYIAMEYLNGRDLGSVVRESGPVAAPRAVDFMIQTCMALEVAHHAGVIHRDIKPENLFLVRNVDDGDQIKLLDFGIVRFREPGASNLTFTGILVGTPVYIAPELWTGAAADERSDIYSLGVSLYFILTGRWPFAENDRTGSGRRAPIFASLGPTERVLEDIVSRCLAPDPAQRMPSARVLREALESCRATMAT